MINEWVPVEEDLPPIMKGFSNVTRDVIVKLKSQETTTAFYNYYNDSWYTAKGCKKIKKSNVIAWTDY